MYELKFLVAYYLPWVFVFFVVCLGLALKRVGVVETRIALAKHAVLFGMFLAAMITVLDNIWFSTVKIYESNILLFLLISYPLFILYATFSFLKKELLPVQRVALLQKLCFGIATTVIVMIPVQYVVELIYGVFQIPNPFEGLGSLGLVLHAFYETVIASVLWVGISIYKKIKYGHF